MFTSPVMVQSRIQETCSDLLGCGPEYGRMTCPGTVRAVLLRKVALEGCGCAEDVTTRMRDLDALAVKAEARGVAWSASEYWPVWLRLADRIRRSRRMPQ